MISSIRSALLLFDRTMSMQAIGLGFLILVSGLLEGLGLGLVLPLLQMLADPSSLPTWLTTLFQVANLTSEAHKVAAIGVALVLVYLIKNLVSWCLVRGQSYFLWHNTARFSSRLLSIYLRRPYLFHLENNSAGLVRNLTVTVNQYFNSSVIPILSLAAEVIVAAAVITVVMIKEPLAALVAVIVFALPMAAFVRHMRRRLRILGQQGHELREKILVSAHHSLGGVKEIKVLGHENHFIEEFVQLNESYKTINVGYLVIREVPRMVLEMLAITMMAILPLAFTMQGRSLSQTLPVMGLFALAAFRLMPSVNRIGNIVNGLAFNEAAVADLAASLSDEPAAPSKDHRPGERFRSMALSAVEYTYADGHAALRNVSLEIKAGESIGIVGSSGAGKTTLINVLLGLLPPSTGQILIDGVPSASVPGWHGRVGFVPQDIYLTDQSLRENIAFGLPKAKIDEPTIAEVTVLAQLQPLIDRLQQGLDTVVGERGTRLSGGQKQRVAIARALYNDPDILILDEATSALDAETEASIIEALQALHGIKTTITVAHRLSTVRSCDRIYWMEQGRIGDVGTFDELCASNSEFANMAKLMGLHPSSQAGASM